MFKLFLCLYFNNLKKQGSKMQILFLRTGSKPTFHQSFFQLNSIMLSDLTKKQ